MDTIASRPGPALAGVRVLDFTSILAGPFPTLLLGFLGAQVIKVESRAQVDGARRPPYAYDDPESSPVFNTLNLNKLGVQLNLKQPRAIQLALRLASVSDAVVENMRPGVMKRLGLGYQEFRAANPDIIMVSISAAGAAGPESQYPGYAPVFNALSGMGHLTGYPDAPPTELRDSIDSRVGATTAFALLSALFHRRRTGQGQFIDLSSKEAITAFGVEALMEYMMNGRVAHRQGNREPGLAPHGCYRCRGEDSWVTIAVGDDSQWRALCQATGRLKWLDDPRFADQYQRSRHQNALGQLLEEWTQGHTTEEVVELLQAAGVAAAASASSQDLATDPHLRAAGAWRTVEHPVMGSQTVLAPPWKFSATPATIHSAAPLIGQHNHQVFVELLGHTVDEVEEWVSLGIIE